MELEVEDRHKTTFNTEWGMFRYLRVLWRELHQNTHAILDECPGKPAENDFEKVIDDIIQCSENMGNAFFRIYSILSDCNQNGMVFSRDKCQFASKSVVFQITMRGIQPTDK